MLRNATIGFIGVGHMGQAIIKALVDSKTVDPSKLFATNRSPGKLKKVQELYGVTPVNTNEELVEKCQVIIIAVKPQDLNDALETIATAFTDDKIVLSLAAGFPIRSLKKLLPNVRSLVRVMPNTPATIQRAVVGIAFAPEATALEPMVRQFLEPLGYVVITQEGEPFEALTVSCGSGPGFIFELMQYWQEWIEEHGFDSETARRMVVETFLGASMLAERARQTGLQELQDRVVSKKGVTAAGLQSMRELEIDRALRISFEKAVLRDQELARNS